MVITSGRIVGVFDGVDTTGTGHDRPGGRIEGGTVGAGAERSAVDSPVHTPATVASRVDTWLDATGLLVAPGFTDLQCNGALGVDLTSDHDNLAVVAAALPRWGVTAWLPTVVTSSPAARRGAMRALAAHDDPDAATPLGLHLEGPFLAAERRGAHDPERLVAPSTGLVSAERWSSDAGVAMVTLAPELPGALDVVRVLVDAGVVVSAGHSAATAAQARVAVDAGVACVTHLFNAMSGLHHREPGLAGVALTDPRLRVGLIADGVHVDPTVVALAAAALGDRMVLVTDAVAALGAGPGARQLGPLAVDVPTDVPTDVPAEGGAARLADGTLAGSTLTLDRAVRNVMAFADADLVSAVHAVTAAPAAALGLHDRGVVAPGAVGDLVLLTPEGEVVATVVAGRVVHDVRTAPSGAPASPSARSRGRHAARR